MDSAREFFSDAKIHIDLLTISGKKILLGSLIWLCFACLFYYFLTFFPILSIFFFPSIIAIGDAVLTVLL